MLNKPLLLLTLTLGHVFAFIPQPSIGISKKAEPLFTQIRGGTSKVKISSKSATDAPPIIPVTLLSGFLGVGKTSLLQNILVNREGLRIGMIVNDVASINIDSKLVRGSSNAEQYEPDTVELENGCVCCSLRDELITSIAQLIDIASKRGYSYDHIVIEASGIAEPKGVRTSFQSAGAMNLPLVKQVRLDTMVTVVDARQFLDAYLCNDRIAQRADLVTSLTPSDEKFSTAMSEEAAYRAVVDLLVEQVECSDVVVINKMDTIDEKKEQLLRSIISKLSPMAKVLSSTYGKLPISETLGCMNGKGMAESGIIDDHKDMIKILEANEATTHAHDCKDADCSDPSHDHANDCKDADCTDPSHNHRAKDATTASTRFGVTSFVYRARKPFNPERLTSFFKQLPLESENPITLLDAARSVSVGEDESVESESGEKTDLKDALKRLVRSKGFLWLANSDIAAMYWSHSGRYFEVQCLGRWWASIPQSDWPKNSQKSIKQDFEGSEGDRRQELVFIGFDIDNPKYKNEIVNGLNQCLLDDSEWAKYNEIRGNVSELREAFPSRIPIQIMM
mmetsp:Transcript_14680/g.21861  ORF Transcript_14680/g.21861 Transcript_14680/m.21861 type:complete len:564 (-) Transcript_14680:3-1694(-)